MRTERSDGELRYGIDRMVVNGRRMFGWGWIAHPTRCVDAVTLNLAGKGWERRLPVNFGLARQDVSEAFPDFVNAGSSGFVVTGYVPGEPAARVWLEVTLRDGAACDIDVTHLADSRYSERRRRRMLVWLVRAVWRRLKRGDVRGILRRARAQSYAVPSLDRARIVRAILPALPPEQPVSIVFDHNMGGGANHYRDSLVGERLAAGHAVLLCTYNLPTLDYRLRLLHPDGSEKVFRIASFLVLERVLEGASVVELFLNSPVSFDEPLVLAEWLVRMRVSHPTTRLIVTAHDYFSVCPSFVLLNADGRYCGIPPIVECAACLKRHQASYVALSPPTDIGPWRAIWGRCLTAADEVRCFSVSTRQHLTKAYPNLPPERINVVPHELDYVPARLPTIDHRAPLVIGIMGQISVHKGALVVKDMLDRIDRDYPEVEAVVLGTFDVAHDSPRLRVTGKYRRDDLVDLIESHGINMFLFPSIWPETFSYVVAEMVRLDVPVVAFDLGAPAERLRHYHQARLCGETTADAALEALIDFHRQLAMRQTSVA